MQTADQWASEYELVKKYGKVAAVPPVTDMMDTTLVTDLYQDGKLIWPAKKAAS